MRGGRKCKWLTHKKEVPQCTYQKRGRGLRRYCFKDFDFCCDWYVVVGRNLCVVQGHYPAYSDTENPKHL